MNGPPRNHGNRDGMPRCPKCKGSGRVGPNRAPCRACWLYGVVEPWRLEQLAKEGDDDSEADAERELITRSTFR